ncbi:MAG: hypothetical protein WAV98_01355 [Minisyncoccia bacterium]
MIKEQTNKEGMAVDSEGHQLLKEIFPQLVESAIICGVLVVADLSNKKLVDEKIRKWVRQRAKSKHSHFVIIHQDTLLSSFEQSVKEDDFNLAYVFLATYFEHFINEIIQIWTIRNDVPNSTLKELLKYVSFEGKFTWLIDVMKLPKFNRKHFNLIKKVSEKRSSFLHYKFQGKSEEEYDYEENESKLLFKEICSTINYCKAYRKKIIFKEQADISD